MSDISIKDLVKNNHVNFKFYRAGNFYYEVKYHTGEYRTIGFMGGVEMDVEKTHTYQFPVPIEDIGNATLLDYDKAITFMRWIRKAKEEGTLVLT
jgi:hypothetical protein